MHWENTYYSGVIVNIGTLFGPRLLTLEYKTQEGGELCYCQIFANSQFD